MDDEDRKEALLTAFDGKDCYDAVLEILSHYKGVRDASPTDVILDAQLAIETFKDT